MLTRRTGTVPNYQTETAQQIFNRVMFNTDVATGKNPSIGSSTTGPNSAFTKSQVPPAEEFLSCYLWDILETCTKVQKEILQNGSAIVEDYILIGYKQAHGPDVFFNGTNAAESGTGPSPSASGDTTTSAASVIVASGGVGAFLLSVAALIGLRAFLF
jgi:hypothetical protein